MDQTPVGPSFPFNSKTPYHRHDTMNPRTDSQNLKDLKDSQFEVAGTGADAQHQHQMVNEQDKKKAQSALHEDIRPEDLPKGSQQGGAHAAQQ